ncbi:hypothetical protein E5161_13810 [Cohnella pontilimi]|uniref:Uncharacterized protein n=1 Tax=Cohnella pontilimi TaxID=2564100 RepID=A0A4U0F9M9_9BACL|nr:hypothetical protein [Cohnella pontilimi]TJY41473.1 hypothetical protein E5161_13810 [Cohnella pontilimi]
MAEVEVHTGQPHDPELAAYFRKAPQGYEMVRVAVNDADTHVDWFDNNMHDAFQDVTASLFAGPGEQAESERDAFAAAVLSRDGVLEQLDKHISSVGK